MEYLEKLESVYNTIGNTPLIKLEFKFDNKKYTVYAKEEFLNPSDSIKIRPAYEILHDAIKSGKLKEGQNVLEVTSGNMGIALAYLCKKIGNPITILMPKTMSKERIDILKEMGANVELTNDFLESFKKEEIYAKKGYFLTKQFENTSNLKAHKKTAIEVLNKTHDFSATISGVGTGGTLIGMGAFLKKEINAKVIAIEPEESGILKYGVSKGKHKIQGLADEIVPKLYDKNIVDKVIEIKSDDAICMARRISNEYGIKVGISSGANVLGCLLSGEEKTVTVFPDDDKKYYSTDLFNLNIKSDLVEEIEFISAKVL